MTKPPSLGGGSCPKCTERRRRSPKGTNTLIHGLLTSVAACLAAIIVTLLGVAPLSAQPPTPTADAPTSSIASVRATIAAEPATFSFFNRPIVSLHARVLGRTPLERAQAAEAVVADLVAQGAIGPVQSQPIDGGSLITVASRGVLVLTLPDVDANLGETLPQTSARAVSRLEQAIAAAVEGRAPRLLLRSGGLALLALFAGLVLIWAVARARGAVSARLAAISERTITQTGLDMEAVRASRLVEFQRRLLRALALIIDVAVSMRS
jgi:hypothetical protein